MTPVLEVVDLTKQFGQFTAVDHISFSVKEGEIVGLLGPNGAGKTTTIHMLLGLITPQSGSIQYFGHELKDHREYCLSRINFASAYTQIQNRMTVMQSMRIYAGLYGIPNWRTRTEDVLKLLEVEEQKDQVFWHLSSGQKTRVILARALLNNPRLILMDEPTASLDPDIANKVIELVRDLQQKEKVTILYTSHDMAEVEALCDRVMFLDHGKIVAEDTPLGLTKMVGKARLTITFDGKPAVVSGYFKKKDFVHRFPRKQVVEVEVEEKEIPKVLFGLSDEGLWLTNIEIQKPNLEDVFLTIARGRYEHPKN